MTARTALRNPPVGYHFIVLLEKARWNAVHHHRLMYQRHGGQRVHAFEMNLLRAQSAMIPMS